MNSYDNIKIISDTESSQSIGTQREAPALSQRSKRICKGRNVLVREAKIKKVVTGTTEIKFQELQELSVGDGGESVSGPTISNNGDSIYDPSCFITSPRLGAHNAQQQDAVVLLHSFKSYYPRLHPFHPFQSYHIPLHLCISARQFLHCCVRDTAKRRLSCST